jgi:hypothetical protein
VDFDVDDKVWVIIKYWRTNRPSRKLSSQNAGPYMMLEKIGYSFKLDLFPSIKVYPIFHVNKLWKYLDNPLQG